MFEKEIDRLLTQEAPVSHYTVSFTVNITEAEREKLIKIFQDNGIEVISENTCNNVPLEDNIGKKVSVICSLPIASDVLIKTPLSTYLIKQIVLPKDTCGTIVGISGGKYLINFDTDLPISPYDVVSGNLTDIPCYPLSTYTLSPKDIVIF